MSSFITTFSGGASCKFIKLVNLHTDYKQEGLHRWLKMTHIHFSILNSHVTVIHLRFIKSTNFYVVKNRKIKNGCIFPAIYPCIYKMCLFSSSKTVSKIKWFLWESYISKFVKRIENITCRKALKYILALDEESERNLVLVTFRTFLIERLALPIFLLYQVKASVLALSNLATGYTRSTWHPGR